MTALAMDVLRDVSEAGGAVRLEGEMLRLSAPEPLPVELRARLHQHKAEIVALLSAAGAGQGCDVRWSAHAERRRPAPGDRRRCSRHPLG